MFNSIVPQFWLAVLVDWGMQKLNTVKIYVLQIIVYVSILPLGYVGYPYKLYQRD